MRAVGEVMSIGKTYKEAFQKAIRSLETGRYGLGWAKDFASKSKEELLAMLAAPSSERQFIMYEALRKGRHSGGAVEPDEDQIDIRIMKELVEEEELLLGYKGQVPPEGVLRQAKLDGFSDPVSEPDPRRGGGRHPRGPRAPLHCGALGRRARERHAGFRLLLLELPHRARRSGGAEQAQDHDSRRRPEPHRQGIEFDYCCVHAALALKDLGFETIIVNCNPETVSTDYDTSDKLYFEPLTLEDVLSIYEKEKPLGVIAQFGGQTPLNLASSLKKAGVNILGTTPETIDMAEDRDLFRAMMDKLGIPMPESGMATTADEAKAIANRIGYPVMVRPSYVLGGRGMEVVYDDEAMTYYMNAAVGVTPDRPILIDRFLHHATECEADAISDGENVFVPAVMEHIELAGVHSGDSACILPSRGLTAEQVATIKDYTKRIAAEMHVVGLMNMQYAIEDGRVFVLEANPRASRTVPLVSKVCNIKMVRIATDIMTSHLTGRPSPVPALREQHIPHYGVKEAVFPFNMFQEVDPILGPEMRSTGEVLGLASTVGEAFFKAEEATQAKLPLSGTVLISVNDRDKAELEEVARGFASCGFRIIATGGTYNALTAAGIPAQRVAKINEGRPNVLDSITNGEVSIIVNTPLGKKGAVDDSYIRKAAIKGRIPYMTTMAAAKATVEGIRAANDPDTKGVRSLQEFHAAITDAE